MDGLTVTGGHHGGWRCVWDRPAQGPWAGSRGASPSGGKVASGASARRRCSSSFPTSRPQPLRWNGKFSRRCPHDRQADSAARCQVSVRTLGTARVRLLGRNVPGQRGDSRNTADAMQSTLQAGDVKPHAGPARRAITPKHLSPVVRFGPSAKHRRRPPASYSAPCRSVICSSWA